MGVLGIDVTIRENPELRSEFCPSLKGANAAFNKTAINFEKLLAAASEIFHLVQVQKQHFTAKPFKDRFPESTVTDHQWYHAFLALNVSMS